MHTKQTNQKKLQFFSLRFVSFHFNELKNYFYYLHKQTIPIHKLYLHTFSHPINLQNKHLSFEKKRLQLINCHFQLDDLFLPVQPKKIPNKQNKNKVKSNQTITKLVMHLQVSVSRHL